MGDEGLNMQLQTQVLPKTAKVNARKYADWQILDRHTCSVVSLWGKWGMPLEFCRFPKSPPSSSPCPQTPAFPPPKLLSSLSRWAWLESLLYCQCIIFYASQVTRTWIGWNNFWKPFVPINIATSIFSLCTWAEYILKLPHAWHNLFLLSIFY